MKIGLWFLFLLSLLLLAVGVRSENLLERGCTGWNRSTYSEPFAKNTLFYAYGAYCPSNALESWTCKWCKSVPHFQVNKVIDVDALQAFTGYDPTKNQIVIAFRGSSNIENWVETNIDILPTSYPGVDGALIHKGFLEAWQDIKFKVMPSVHALIRKYNTSQILVTGHSLGGALAQVASLEIFSYANQVSSGHRVVVTYGAPRWCNDVLVQYFVSLADVHWRIVNVHDAVPTLPLKSKHYHHTPIMVWYTSDNPLRFVVCDESGEDPNCRYLGNSISYHLNYLNVHEAC